MDLCDAYFLALVHLLSHGESRQYNLGDGDGDGDGDSVLNNVIRTIELVKGKKIIGNMQIGVQGTLFA